MPEEDQPPERIWLDTEELTGHFENVKARRSTKTGGETVFEEIEPMTENTAQADEIRRLRGD